MKEIHSAGNEADDEGNDDNSQVAPLALLTPLPLTFRKHPLQMGSRLVAATQRGPSRRLAGWDLVPVLFCRDEAGQAHCFRESFGGCL